MWKYLDHWPKIPDNLLLENINNAESLKLQFANSPGERVVIDKNQKLHNMQYRRWDVTQELHTWIIDNINNFDEIGIQYFYREDDRSRLFPHCDKVNRRWVFLYIDDTGGQSVKTNFYKERDQDIVRPHRTMVDDLSLLEKITDVVFETHRWVVINGLVLHDVYPVETIRKSVVCGMQQEDIPKFIPW